MEQKYKPNNNTTNVNPEKTSEEQTNLKGKKEGIAQQKQQTKKKTQASASKTHKCSNPDCGATVLPTDNFCTMCGMPQKTHSCKNCGAATEPNWEICPVCKHNLKAEICSFCGEQMSEGDNFCLECGNPRAGIVCPQCSSLNFRSFCYKCNFPLNNQAQQALKQAKEDPKFRKALALAEELAELEELIIEFQEAGEAPPELAELSEENKALIDQYKDLLSMFREEKTEEKAEEKKLSIDDVDFKSFFGNAFGESDKKEDIEAAPAETKTKINLSFSIANKEEALNKYKEKLSEMQETLQSMIPDAGMTPQLQRDFYSARKIEHITKSKKRVTLGWRCNAYGCYHNQPNDCVEPFKGGEWIYEEREEITSTWVAQ